jgi:hypothetical protein
MKTTETEALANGSADVACGLLQGGKRRRNKKRPWGRRKSLKRLDPDKENKVVSFV